MQFMIPELGASGGVSVSGAHHPQGWNSISLFDGSGGFMSPSEGEVVLEVMRGGEYHKARWNEIGHLTALEEGCLGAYFERLTAFLDVKAIRARGFKVLMDPVCGSACLYLERLAGALGISLVAINGKVSGYLPREAEPRPRSASQVASVIGAVNADAGFLLSSDGGRLSLVTEDGEPLSEECTFALITRHMLAKKAGTIVTNCCTTGAVDDAVREFGGTLVKTRVGQPYITAAMLDEGARLGGEGNGSVCVPAFSRAFDGFLMTGLILEMMAHRGKKLSELRRQLSARTMIKRRIDCDSQRGYAALNAVRDIYRSSSDWAVDVTDGVRLDDAAGWIHVRVSRTQHAVRIMAESEDREWAENRVREMERSLRRYC
jgi:phosphomannomutase